MSATDGECRRRLERGQLIPIVAVGIVALLAMLALAVDLGYWRYQQRLEQSAADSAAVAGSIATYYTATAPTPPPTSVKDAAQRDAAKNGFADDNGIGNVTVTVNNPPLTGTHATDNGAVEVVISKKQPAYFASAFGTPNQTVSARSVATHVLDPKPACLYQLATTSYINLAAGSVNAINCSVSANGPVSVGGTFTATGLAWYGTTAPNFGNTYSGPVVQIPTPLTDPCLRIPSCAYLSAQALPATPPASAVSDSSTLTAVPSGSAVYVRGGITTPTFFNPGIYYIYGGISAGVSGTGVTIVNVNGAFLINGNKGGGNVPTVTAPSTGPTAGIAYFQPPSNSSGFTGNGTPTTWNGLYYAPTSVFQSNGKLDNYAELVIAGININGQKALTVDPNLGPSLTAVQQALTPTHAALAE